MKHICSLMLCLALLGAVAWAQEAGDYRSRQSGNWRNVNTWQTWDGAGWINATVKPGPANNVLVQAGHTVILAASPDSCRNLAVEAGGTLYCNNAANRYVHVYGDSITNHGTLGGANDGLSFQFYNDLRLASSSTMTCGCPERDPPTSPGSGRAPRPGPWRSARTWACTTRAPRSPAMPWTARRS
jgi:hypothetical protein